jgi:uncharacterized protein (TIGR02466 family)
MDAYDTEQKEMLSTDSPFQTMVYHIDKPEFLEMVGQVAEESLIKAKEKVSDEFDLTIMSENIFNDPRVEAFAKWVGQTAWNILDSQGYDMSQSVTHFTEMWVQEHHKNSDMAQHVHGGGNQIVGFYFLECPDKCSSLVLHDPKPGKVQINLKQKDVTKITAASTEITYKPQKGKLVFTNAWLPHSFTRHGADEPIKFVHFNLDVREKQISFEQVCKASNNVEII